ncbi:YtxH domain-containing protein [Neobacillus ginsengisoli]|uniref:Gas vesicle protein n=1 Tax=Neobacillus ginsengisoli TaxID=904295 RepID=A0ABT9XYH8_9BACI|nr:YtxH domain-containing protein [Neobacillus ginsengisoli]MDQ0200617.1 gas vesicle protein [Neobacillus ginsengisoli]
MTRKNQFWKGMLFGAIAGGALSLLDKQTRSVMKENLQNATDQASYILRNPGEISKKVKGTAVKIKYTVEQVSEDINYIIGKVDELKELTPQVTDMLKDTKDAFSKSEENELFEDILGEDDKDLTRQ